MNTITTPTTLSTEQVNARRLRRTWLKRTALFMIFGVFLLATAGSAFQAIATSADRRSFPPPGQMVDAGGFQMHISCMGEGSPTVVLEGGGGTNSLAWFLVQPEIAKSTLVCAYDRAGMGWSDPGPGPRDGRRIATELDTLLHAAEVPGPYVLAGWSYGGLFIRAYTDQFPDQVAGLVLLDGTHPDVWTRAEAGQAQYQNDSKIYAGMRVFARFGLLRFFEIPFTAPPDSLPIENVPQWKAAHSTTRFIDTTEAESRSILATMAQVRQAGHLGDLPVMVVTAGENRGADGQWQAFQSELASSLSMNSAHRILEGAGHPSLIFDPQYSQGSSRAIVHVVEAVRNGVSLEP
jgi:pimeloyl-ACP methyl ester carboxylesterase